MVNSQWKRNQNSNLNEAKGCKLCISIYFSRSKYLYNYEKSLFYQKSYLRSRGIQMFPLPSFFLFSLVSNCSIYSWGWLKINSKVYGAIVPPSWNLKTHIVWRWPSTNKTSNFQNFKYCFFTYFQLYRAKWQCFCLP